MFQVITVAREYGSGGGNIARIVAEKLGWDVLDRALIAAVARAAQVDLETAGKYDEHIDSWWHRWNRGGLQGAAAEIGMNPHDAQFFDAETMAAFSREAISKAAEAGKCVIVGRGAQCILQDREEAFHVFVYAPWKDRVERVRARDEFSGPIDAYIAAVDRRRATYVRRYYGCDWKDPHLYDLMVSSKSGTKETASLVIDAVTGR